MPYKNIDDRKKYQKQWYEKNKKIISEQSKIYYEKNKNKIKKRVKSWTRKNKERVKDYNKEYYIENKDKILNNVNDYRIKNKDKIREKNRKYARKNKNKVILWKNRYQLKQILNGISVYKAILERCNNIKAINYKNYGGRGIRCLLTCEQFQEIYFSVNRCQICNCKLNDANRRQKDGRTVDRINNNGHYEIGNLQIVCRSCNIRKSNKERKDNKNLLLENYEK